MTAKLNLIATPQLPTSSCKTRVRDFCGTSSSRISSRQHCRSMSATCSHHYCYRTVSGRSAWPNQDPIQERGGLNLYDYVQNNPVNRIDPLGLEGNPISGLGGAWNNNPYGPGGSFYGPGYLFPPPPPPQINGPVSGLLNYMFGNGDPATIGPDLSQALQDLQKAKPWPQTDGGCPPNTPRHIGLRDYGSWQHPYDDYLVEFSLGHFDYSNNGTTTTVSDVYAFPFTSSGTGLSSWRNTPYSWIPGTTYSDSGSWPTPNAHP